jgi:hypothetical protein
MSVQLAAVAVQSGARRSGIGVALSTPTCVLSPVAGIAQVWQRASGR